MVRCLQTFVALTGDLLSGYLGNSSLALVTTVNRFFRACSLRLVLKLRHGSALLRIQGVELAIELLQQLFNSVPADETSETGSQFTGTELCIDLVALRSFLARRKALLELAFRT